MKNNLCVVIALMMCLTVFFASCKKQDDVNVSSVIDEATSSTAEVESGEKSEESDVSNDIVFSAEESIDSHSTSVDAAPTFSQSKFYGMETLHYTALGDSIARGYGLNNPELNCYPALLSNALSAVLEGTDVVYTNYAVDGMTTQGLKELLENGAEAVDNADLISVCIGANNLLHNFLAVVEKHMPSLVSSSGTLPEGGLESSAFIDAVKAIEAEVESEEFALLMNDGIEELKTDLAYIIDLLKKRAPNAEIVITTVYSPYHGIDLSLPYLGISFDMGAVSDRWVSALNVEIVRIATDKQCVLVEAYNHFEAKGGLINAALSLVPFNFNFDPHPNIKGHKELSNLHIKAIRNIQ